MAEAVGGAGNPIGREVEVGVGADEIIPVTGKGVEAEMGRTTKEGKTAAGAPIVDFRSLRFQANALIFLENPLKLFRPPASLKPSKLFSFTLLSSFLAVVMGVALMRRVGSFGEKGGEERFFNDANAISIVIPYLYLSVSNSAFQ